MTALFEFMVDSRNLQARRSQKSMRPIPGGTQVLAVPKCGAPPVPIVRMLPLKETDRIPQPELREGIFLTD